jgi:TetR/AcrR family transcriptional repressor of bet genes
MIMARVDIHAIRREQILSAAERLLAQKGWSKTTFADICKEAGISNGVLTYHFKDKDEILLAVLQKVSCDLQDKNYPLLNTPQSLQDKLGMLVHDNLAATGEQRELCLLSLHLLSIATQRPEIAQWMQQVHNETFQQTRSAVEQAIEQGEIEQRDPTAVSAVLNMLLVGASVVTTVYDFDIPAKKLIEEIMIMIRRYLKMDDEKKDE